MGSSSRDFVESYVKDISQDTEAYLAQQQPNYDATKTNPMPSPPSTTTTTTTTDTPKKEDTPVDPSAHFAFHKATTNPITPASDYTQQQQQQQQQQEPQVVWTVRDSSDQRREIHETALINCSDLHVDLMQCFQHGSWWDKAKMCEDQKQKFWACFHSQKKFLKAANYKGPISTPEDDDLVLMRALNFRDEQEAAKTTEKDESKGDSSKQA